MRLFTVGYEGCKADEFVAALKKNGIDYVVDVRKNPLSHKPGFSKTKLSERLARAGIEYLHLPALGVPSEWRQRLKQKSLTRDHMFKAYAKKILPKQKEELDNILALAKEHQVALLCFEDDPHDCHRHMITEFLKHQRHRLQVLDLHPHFRSSSVPHPDH